MDRKALIKTLTGVFKAAGYHGATLSHLAQATNLKRASLYHHFPGGKEEMASAVMAQNGADLGRWVLSPLSTRKPARDRLLAMLDGMDRFYAIDPPSCLINTLSLQDETAALREGVAVGARSWLTAMEQAFSDLNRSDLPPRETSERLLGELQGSLVLCRVLAERGPFDRCLKRWRTILAG